MPVLMTSDMPGTTQEGYEHLAAALVPTMQASPGFIAHAAGPVEGGYVVTELWESEQAHEAWFAQHVRPAMPADAAAPSITYRPIANIATAPH
jgi:heme-degrading monooxygenase HmoA